MKAPGRPPEGPPAGGLQGLQRLAAVVHRVPHRPQGDGLKLQHLLGELGLIRHRQFRRIGGRSRPQVCHKICDRHVRFMPYRGNHGDCAVVNRTGHPFVVEAPEVLRRAAASARNQKIRQSMGTGIPDSGGNLSRRLFPLYADREEKDLRQRIPRPQDAQHISHRCAGRRGDQRDPPWISRNVFFMRRVK